MQFFQPAEGEKDWTPNSTEHGRRILRVLRLQNILLLAYCSTFAEKSDYEAKNRNRYRWNFYRFCSSG
jgi:hypothetical protein